MTDVVEVPLKRNWKASCDVELQKIVTGQQITVNVTVEQPLITVTFKLLLITVIAEVTLITITSLKTKYNHSLGLISVYSNSQSSKALVKYFKQSFS